VTASVSSAATGSIRPVAAALANAVFDATGVRLRRLRETLDRKAIEAAMGESWLARFLKFGKPSRTFSCYARTAKAKRAA